MARDDKPLRQIVRPKELDQAGILTDLQRRRLESRGLFPARFKIADESRLGACGYWKDEIETWLLKRGTPEGPKYRPQPKPDKPKAQKKGGKKAKPDVALMP